MVQSLPEEVNRHSSSSFEKKSPFWAIDFLRKFCQIWSDFHFFGFCKSNFLQSKVEDHISVFMSSSDQWPSYTPRHWLAFYDSQGYGGHVSATLYMGRIVTQLIKMCPYLIEPEGSLPLYTILSQMNPIHILICLFLWFILKITCKAVWANFYMYNIYVLF
jgi:hypothetical protein